MSILKPLGMLPFNATTPLLLMFALERMTARNSRRRQAADAIVERARPNTP